MFSGEFKVQSACVSNDHNGKGSEYLALGGTDGLIEIWDF